MKQEYYMSLFDNLDNDVYEEVIRFLKQEKFTIKGFRDIRKIPRKRLVRGLMQDAELLTKTLYFISDYYGIRTLVLESMGEQQLSVNEMNDLYEKLEADYPEKRNGFLATFLAAPISPQIGKFILSEMSEELTEEEVDSLEKDELNYKELYEGAYEAMVEEFVEQKEIEEDSTASEEKKLEAEAVQKMEQQHQKEENTYKEKYSEAVKRNKELNKKNKAQKIELRMLQEDYGKKEMLLKKSEMKETQLLNQILELQQQLGEERENYKALQKKFNELQEVLERPRILYIGLKRDFRLYSRTYQVSVLEEEEVDLEMIRLSEYDSIWLVDNEVGSLSMKMKLCSLAKQQEVPVKHFYGETGLMEFLRQEEISCG